MPPPASAQCLVCLVEARLAEQLDEQQLGTREGRCRWVREKVLGMSGAELAAALMQVGYVGRDGRPISGAAISRYESGDRSLPDEYVIALSELSGMNLDWLFFWRGEGTSAVQLIGRMRELMDEWETILTTAREGRGNPVPTLPLRTPRD